MHMRLIDVTNLVDEIDMKLYAWLKTYERERKMRDAQMGKKIDEMGKQVSEASWGSCLEGSRSRRRAI